MDLSNIKSVFVEKIKFDFYSSDDEDRFIRGLIVSYLKCKKDGLDIVDVKLGERSFNSYDVSNSIIMNIFMQLELVLGKDVLVKTLTMGSFYLKEQIDKFSGKSGNGNLFCSSIICLKDISDDVFIYDCIKNVSDSLIKDKLLVVYRVLCDNINNVNSINTLLNLMEINNFDYSILRKIDKRNELAYISKITNLEKEIIKFFIMEFNSGNYNKNDDLLCLDYPSIRNKGIIVNDKKYYGSEYFSFINKYITVYNKVNLEYDEACKLLDSTWNNIMDIIFMCVNNRRIDSSLNLDKLLYLSNYRILNDEYGSFYKNGNKLVRQKNGL